MISTPIKYLICTLLIVAGGTAFAQKSSKKQPAKAKQETKAADTGAVKPSNKQNYIDMENLDYDGIDVSSWQRDIDWRATAKDKKIKFVYIKASEGANYRSRHYVQNVENARKHGILVGSYHFLRPNVPIEKQFENFSSVAKIEDQDLVPLIDIEVRGQWTAQQIADSVEYFAQLLEEHYGCRPMIYTGSAFYNSYLSGRIDCDYPLFIARYSKVAPKLSGGAKWTLWQFSERGRIAGIDHYVDLCRFNSDCDVNDLLVKKNRIKNKGKDRADKNKKSPDKADKDAVPHKKTLKTEEKAVPFPKNRQPKASDKENERVAEQQAKLRERKNNTQNTGSNKAKATSKAADKENERVAEQQAKLRDKKSNTQNASTQKTEKQKAENKKQQVKKEETRPAAQQPAKTEKKVDKKKDKQESQKQKTEKAEEPKKAEKISANQKAKKQGKRINQSSSDND